MTIEELEAECRRILDAGNSVIYLSIIRKWPPKSEILRIKGMGNGYLANAVELSDGTFRITGHFSARTILNTIEKEKKWRLDFDEKSY